MDDSIKEGPPHGQSDVSASLLSHGVLVKVRCDEQSTACGLGWDAALRLRPDETVYIAPKRARMFAEDYVI